MDCFYAAVEMRERPELRLRPIAVGGTSERAVLTTCNYPARAFGIRSAMPVFQARQLCPQLIILPVRFEMYRAASQQIRAIFARYSELVEPLSLDEAYLDVSHLPQRGSEIAQEIRQAIRTETGLTASAGIAPNKLLAKIASDWNKPNGQCVISPSKVSEFMRQLPVRKIWGVGPKSNTRLSGMGVETCQQLQRYSAATLVGEFGSFGFELYQLCRGVDKRAVQANRMRQSLSNERTYSRDIESLASCERALGEQYQELIKELSELKPQRKISKLLVKLKFSDHRRTTAEMPGQQAELKLYRKLLHDAWGRSGESVRLLGLGVRFAQMQTGLEQLDFFQQWEPTH